MVHYYKERDKGKLLINKVKPPVPLKLVHSSQESKNDLGGQSGESYSAPPDPSEAPPRPETPVEATADPETAAAAGSVPDPQIIQDQVGLTAVVKEWLEESKPSNSISRSRLSVKYQGESAPAKGMLLNKKIS